MLFRSVLEKNDPEVINSVANVIEYYTTYGELLLNVETMGDYPLYLGIIRTLMEKPVGTRTLDLASILEKFDLIIEKGEVSSSVFIEDLNKWKEYIGQYVTNENIHTIIPSISFFTSALEVENELTRYCIDTAKEYLDSIDFEQWKEHLEDTSTYEVQLSLLFPDYELTPALVDAVKYTLERIAKQELIIENWEDWDNILSRTNTDNKQTVFRNIRDLFCTSVDINTNTFLSIGDWLFEFGSLEDRKESLRRILRTEIVRNDECREVIANNKNKLKAILENTDDAEVSDFKSTIRELLDNDDESAKEIAKEIGVRKSRKKAEDDPVVENEE